MYNTQIEPDFIPFYKGKTILITGSVGTVGSELLNQILLYKPKEIRLFDNYESGLFMQMQSCRNSVKVVPVLGDIRDGGKIHSVMEGVDVVFHLAAYKHVELCEHNPFDSVRTNVIGTQNVLKAAIANKVKRVLYTSSDKAVNPTNVMGTSKLLAERVVTASSIPCCNGGNGQIFSSTRFGNVLGSNGSVVPVFTEQIKRGGPVTITDGRMTRFVMTIQEAARLVIKGAALACGGEVFVTKMPVAQIVDLAKAMIELLAPLYGHKPEDISLEYSGSRPGEKLYEELMSEDETARAIELEDMFSVLPALIDEHTASRYIYPGIVSDKVDKAYISRDEKMMTREEIMDYLISNNVLGDELTLSLQRKRDTHPAPESGHKTEILI
ncbi:MAG: polysaccharide biosynthesis protein [Deferribacteres bacterium]|nr:polysaccharide biosynthesis protein [Deferribacteres bacterium]